MKIKFEVSEEDIKKSRRLIKKECRAFSCPVALALRKKLKCTYEVSVTRDNSYLTCNYEVENPRSVRRFIKKFDEKEPVKAFNFFLDVDDDHLDLFK